MSKKIKQYENEIDGLNRYLEESKKENVKNTIKVVCFDLMRNMNSWKKS